MKKMVVYALTAIMSVSVSVYGSEEESASKDAAEKSYDTKDLDSITNALEKEFEDTGNAIMEKLELLLEKLGDSYQTYSQNREAVTEFYAKSLESAEKLYASAETISADYFKCIAADGVNDYDVWNDAMEELYDIWDECMEDFYDVWDDLYEELYDMTDKLVEDGADSLSYEEYSDLWSAMYHEYSDSWSVMYKTYSDAWSGGYKNYSTVWRGFYNEDTNVDELLKKAKKEIEEKEAEESDTSDVPESKTAEAEKVKEDADEAKSQENTADAPELVNGMRPEFKEAMDSYEEFYNQYCDFMVKYSENPTDLALVLEYADMMKQAVDVDEKFKAWEDGELNSEELKYYIDVNSRISQKLLDAAA